MSWQIHAERLTKAFGAVIALDEIDLTIGRGEFCVLVGDSGSGKTTLMRTIAGLQQPDSGWLELRGKVVFSSQDAICVSPQERRIGMVFQSYAIWPHLTVFENVALPLRCGINRVSRADMVRLVGNALEVVGLSAYADRPAPALSGGQQQRVALARALAISTDVMIMDEPMSNLDARLRTDVRNQFRDIARRFDTTVLYVTHDREEAMALADEVAIVEHGRVVSKAPPDELYARSTKRSIANFFGLMNYFEGAAIAADRIADISFGELTVAPLRHSEGRVVVGIRSEDTHVVDGPGPNRIFGQVTSETYHGRESQVGVNSNGLMITAESRRRVGVGESVWIEVPPRATRQFDS
jgi:iron(III) transport system ATP-binding protein